MTALTLTSSLCAPMTHADAESRLRQIPKSGRASFARRDQETADALERLLPSLRLCPSRFYRTTVGQLARACGTAKVGRHTPSHLEYALARCAVGFAPYPMPTKSSGTIFVWERDTWAQIVTWCHVVAGDLGALRRDATPLALPIGSMSAAEVRRWNSGPDRRQAR